jgi:serine/threonine-protein kinase
MGIVFRAQQRSMAREIALKLLSPKYSLKPKWVEQFIGEARAAGKLNHQNIIQVHDVGTENDIHFFSMEFVDGPTCMQMLKEHGSLDIEPALEIVRQVARALDYAHAHRLIHQDIKPDNIMVGSNEVVKLADLGISKTFDEVEAEQGPKKIMGTPHYMSPEAAVGKKIDHRVDLYSLGATLYHLLAGKTPFHGTNPTEVLKAHVMEPLPPIQTLNPKVPREVVELIEKMMKKDPDERIQTAKQVEEEIDRILAGKGFAKDKAGSETVVLRRYAQGVKPGSAEPAMITPEESGPVEVPRSRSMLGLVIAVVAVVALIAVVFFVLRGRGQPAKPVKPLPTVQTVKPTTPTAQDPATSGPDLTRVESLLSDIQSELGKPSDQIRIGELRRLLGEIPGDGLTATLAARRASAVERIESAAKRQATQELLTGFSALQNEAGKLIEEHNYDLARQRLEAFKGREDPLIKPRFDEALVDLDKAKADYVAWLAGQVKLLSSRKDLAGLKALAAGLPQAWLSTPSEAAITAAIKTIEGDRLAAANAVATQAGKHLVAWNFMSLDELARNQRSVVDGTPAAARLDGYVSAAKQLGALTGALANRLQTLQQIRFHGVLSGFTDPDIVGANPDNGLELKEAGGGAVYLRWNKMSAKDLQAVATLVLKAEAKPYIDAIAQLEGAGK